MALESIKEGIDPVILYFLLQPIRLLVAILDCILSVFGLSIQHGSRQEQMVAKKEGRLEGHVVRVRVRVCRHFTFALNLDNFLLTHDSYVNPFEYVKRSNVVTMGFSEKYAYFSITEPGVNLWDVRKIPFFYIFQFNFINLQFCGELFDFLLLYEPLISNK